MAQIIWSDIITAVCIHLSSFFFKLKWLFSKSIYTERCRTEFFSLYILLLFSHSFCLFCNPMDCSPQGSSVYEISYVRILKWVAISFSRGSSPPRDQTCISPVAPALAGRFFTTEPPGKSLSLYIYIYLWKFIH